ncbi:MAG: hypothetical protein PQ612_01020 [Rickettsiales bacterium]|nr:hypothetical protein [Pseudomonadota bacterium]MDA0965503.1 hypothetical protein [Pseudomonadota bacterium]MDG4542827.1 hypothetical protein [Rickettsiales bacterium]MDG4544725.1 hypothetical protein [Rickettsiales bacterium]MDG4546847.1 hypothetical protein [Rickettsiales bacterium]
MEQQHDKTNYEIEPSQTGAFALFVPLYLVILAFFILLNSISDENQKKKEEAISSIEESFSSGSGRTDLENKALFFSFSQIVTTYFDDVEKELKSAYKPDEFTVERKGYKMMIKIPLRKVFEKDSANIIEFQKSLFNRLVKTISLDRRGVDVKINIKVDSQGFSLLDNKDAFEIDKERSTNIVEKFLDNNIEKKHITAGIAFNNEQYLIIETNVKKSDNFFEGLLDK